MFKRCCCCCYAHEAWSIYFSKLNSTSLPAKLWLSSSKVHFMHFTRNFACKNITNSCLVIPFSCLWPITMGRKSLKKMANKGCAGSSQIVTISYAAAQVGGVTSKKLVWCDFYLLGIARRQL